MIWFVRASLGKPIRNGVAEVQVLGDFRVRRLAEQLADDKSGPPSFTVYSKVVEPESTKLPQSLDLIVSSTKLTSQEWDKLPSYNLAKTPPCPDVDECLTDVCSSRRGVCQGSGLVMETMTRGMAGFRPDQQRYAWGEHFTLAWGLQRYTVALGGGEQVISLSVEVTRQGPRDP